MQWGLPKGTLKDVWAAVAGDEGFLSQQQFVQCLYLMDNAKRVRPFTSAVGAAPSLHEQRKQGQATKSAAVCAMPLPHGQRKNEGSRQQQLVRCLFLQVWPLQKGWWSLICSMAPIACLQ